MTASDVLKIVLCSYGYDRKLTIKTYRGESGCVGYEVYAENKDGDSYYEINCEGIIFHVYQILDYMKETGRDFETHWWSYSLKYITDDDLRNKEIINWDAQEEKNKENALKSKPLTDWLSANNPCPSCKINKHDHWDDIHYNCELCHTHSCDILLKFHSDYEKFKSNQQT